MTSLSTETIEYIIARALLTVPVGSNFDMKASGPILGSHFANKAAVSIVAALEAAGLAIALPEEKKP